MRASADPAAVLRRAAGQLLLVLLLAATLVWPLAAQETAEAEAFTARAEASIADPTTPTEILDELRVELVRIRTAAQQEELAQAPQLADLRARLDALGPAPAEGEHEAEEVAQLRADLGARIAAAQAPLLLAQETGRQAATLIQEIDRIVRSRIAAERFGHLPVPVRPTNWARATAEILGHAGTTAGMWSARAADPPVRDAILRRLPVSALLVVSGLIIAFALRRRTGEWVEEGLAEARSARSVTGFLWLRSLNRLVLPLLGAALVLAGLQLAHPLTRPDQLKLAHLLPAWILAPILAGWLVGSFFVPRTGLERLAPLDADDARAGARITMAASLVLLGLYVARDLMGYWQLSQVAQSVLSFPLVLAGALLLWRSSRLVDRVSGTINGDAATEPDGSAHETGGMVGRNLLGLLARGARLIAVLAPVSAAIGYVPASAFFVAGALLTLGLVAAAFVAHDLLSRALALIFRPASDAATTDGGLIPVVVGALVIVACVPLAALIWGTRVTDLRAAWILLAEGMTFGGITISFRVVLGFIFAFGLIAVLTRIVQSLLVSSVLPRTKLDSGGREAVRAGVGYVGYAMAIFVGIDSAGIDLSNLALVAGALSVGIGFGLQTIVSNFVSGIILLVERPIKPGDWIEVGGQMGYVRGIRVRSTEIETFDRASVIVPNSDLIAGTVLNRTHLGMAGRLIVPVTVSYDTDPRDVERILLDIADAHPVVLDDPPPAVIFLSIGPDGMNFELRCRLRDVNFTMTVRSDVNYAIIERFRAEQIAIPLPQRSLTVLREDVSSKPA